MRFAQETFEIAQAAIGRIDAAIIGNIVAVVAQRRGIERHDPNRGRSEILDVVKLFGEAGEIADAVIVEIEKGFHMQLIDDRVAIPFAGHCDQSCDWPPARRQPERPLAAAGTSHPRGGALFKVLI